MQGTVEWYAGYKGEERPVRLRVGQRVLAVEAVLERWYEPATICFKVRAGGGVYLLRRREEPGQDWTIEPVPGRAGAGG